MSKINKIKIHGNEYMINRELRKDWGKTPEVHSGRGQSL